MQNTIINHADSNDKNGSSTKERYLFIDIAKGIGILLVMFAHVNYTPAILTYIYAFHMPLFFVLSGMLFQKEKYRSFAQFLKKRFLTLICPYAFFYLVSLVINFGISVAAQGITPDLINQYFHSFLQMFIAQNSASVINAPLWFIPCLFAVELIYYFIVKMKTAFVLIVCMILTCAGWLLESEYLTLGNVVSPWSLDSALFAIGFYAVGNISFQKVKHIISKIETSKYRIALAVGGALLCALLLAPIAYLNGKISLGSKVLNNGILLYLSGIIGTMGVLLISVVLVKSKFLRYCGQNTFCLMSTHHLIRNVLVAVLGWVGLRIYDNTKIIETIIPFVFVLAASLICTSIYNKIRQRIALRKKL